MKNTNKSRFPGFQRGLDIAMKDKSKLVYDALLRRLKRICMTTESHYNSRSSFYNKRHGRAGLTIAEREAVAAAFLEYGIENWEGTSEKTPTTDVKNK